MPSGGKRDGSGRPRKAELYAAPIRSAEDRIADRLPEIVDQLLKLAMGGVPVVEETWEPAGMITVESPVIIEDDNGSRYPMLGPNGKPLLVKQPAFPETDETELVIVQRKISKTLPDRQALIACVDRIMGRPTQALELNNGEDGPLKIQVVYADVDPPAPEAAPGPGEDPSGDAAV